MSRSTTAKSIIERTSTMIGAAAVPMMLARSGGDMEGRAPSIASSCAGVRRAALTDRSRSLALLPEHFIEVVEHFSAARDALQIIWCRQRDAVDHCPDADGFIAPEFIVLEVDVVNDLRDGAQRRVLRCDAIEQHLEGALVALMCELGLEHVEAQLTFGGAIALAGNELEARVRVDETADQPCARNAVNVHALPRDPGSVAQRCKRVCFWVDFL